MAPPRLVLACGDAASEQCLVGRREGLDVVDQRVDEQSLDDLACAVEEVRPVAELRADATEFRPITITRVPKLECRLDRRVQPSASVEVPAFRFAIWIPENATGIAADAWTCIP